MKEFRTILLGQRLKIYTDHKNITFKTFNTDGVLQWRHILKEYGPDIEYIPVEKNIATDALSLLTSKINQEITHESTYLTEKCHSSTASNKFQKARLLYLSKS